MRPWPGARQLPPARTGPVFAGGPVSGPGPSRSKGNMSRKEREMTMEALSPHAAGEPPGAGERGDRRPGMLPRLAGAAHGCTHPGPGQLVSSTGKRTGCRICHRHRLPHQPPPRHRNPIVPVTRAAVPQLRTGTADMGDERAACTLKSSNADSAISRSCPAGGDAWQVAMRRLADARWLRGSGPGASTLEWPAVPCEGGPNARQCQRCG